MMEEKMEVQKEISGSKGKYYIQNASQLVGEVTFSMAGETLMIIDHTHVEEKHKGTGIGAKILTFLVEDVRNKQIKVLPLCPFANAFFRKNKTMQDVLS